MNKEKLMVIESGITITCDNEIDAEKLRHLNMKDPLGNLMKVEVKQEPTTILSKAIEEVEKRGDYKVMVALVDLDKSKPKEDRLYTFTDIESKKLREVIYKEIEKEVSNE